jgi:hypothetical protein
MKTFLAFLLLCSAAVSAKDTLLKPAHLRDVSLQKLPLKEGERIASIEVTAVGASFINVHIPIDWSFEIGAPVSGVAVLKGEAAHGVGMLFTADEFQRFVTLAFCDHETPPRESSIKVKLGVFFFDRNTKWESERVIELSPESIVLKGPTQPSAPPR